MDTTNGVGGGKIKIICSLAGATVAGCAIGYYLGNNSRGPGTSFYNLVYGNIRQSLLGIECDGKVPSDDSLFVGSPTDSVIEPIPEFRLYPDIDNYPDVTKNR